MKTTLYSFYKSLLAALLLFVSVAGWGQTVIDNSATGSNGTIPTGWTGQNNVTGQDISQKGSGGYYLVEKTNTATDYLVSNTYDLSAYTSVTIEVSIATYGASSTTNLEAQISTNGGSTWTTTATSAGSVKSSTFIDTTIGFSGISLTANTKFRFYDPVAGVPSVRIKSIVIKASGSACTTPTQSFDSASVTKTMGDAPFTNTFTPNSSGTVTYSSSNTGVATVDSTTGQVTLVGPGTANITATTAANGTYCAATQSYTLNVTIPACTGPTTAASAFTSNTPDPNTPGTVALGWTSGNGTNRVAFVKATAFTAATPANNNTYNPDHIFTGAGTAFDGGKTVYNSNGSSVSVTNLTPNTAYNAKVFEYLGAAGSECYNTTPLSGSFTTVSNAPGVLDASNLADVSFDANWTAPTGNGSAAYTYTLEYSTSSTFASNVTAITNIASGTTTRAISGLTPATNYYYRVKVVNAGGSSAWSATKQTTTKPSAPPAPGAPTQACGSTTYPAYGSGAPYNTYYWQTTANGNSTANPGTSFFTVTASGTYYVRALSGASNWSAATPVNAVVINNPVITAQPANKTVANGNTATFSVTATDAGSYQWQENNSGGWVDITDGGNYSGATTATLSVANANIGMDGYTYRVVVGGTAPCNGTVTSNAATLTVTVVTGSAAYFRSADTGNWTNIATWQSSPDNVNWYPATAVPTSSATQIDIRSGHTVSVTTDSQNGKNIHVYGTLSLEEVFAVADDGTAAYDLTVENGGILSFPNTKDYTPTFGAGATALYRATSLTSFVNTSVVGNVLTDNGGSGTKMYFESGARFTVSISGSNSLKSSGVTYFPNADANTTPILQIATGMAQMSSADKNPTVINGRLEVASGATFTSSNGGDRTFRDGIINNGSFSGGTSNIYITGTNAQLGGTGTTTVGTNNSLIIDTGAVATQVTHMAITDGTVTVKGTLSNSAHAYKINANVNIAAGGKFVTYSEGGFFGGPNSAIQEKTPELNTGSTVEYSRAGDQTITNAPVTTPSGANYQNLVVSGSGKKTTAPGSITVNEMTKVTSADAELIVPTPLDNTKIPNVFYALGGINNQNGGKFILANDALLIQHTANRDNADNANASIQVRRLFTWSDSDRKEYNYLSSPVKGQNMKEIFGGDATNVPSVLKLNEATNLFVNASVADYAQQGKGFAVKEAVKGYNNETAQFVGKPNNGTFTTPITKTVASRGWNLIGNPYPSNLDLQQFYEDNVKDNQHKILPEFRYWDNRMNNTYTQYGGAYQGYSYAIYNANSREGNPAPGGDPGDPSSEPISDTADPDLYRYAKVGQGFVVRAAAMGSANLEYKNTQRTLTQPDRGFFGRNEIQKDRYRLQLITPDSLTMTQTILYIPNGLNSVGLEDSKHPSTNASDAFYSMEETSKLLINAKAPFQITDKVLLGNNHFIAGVYKIRAVNRLGIFANGQAIYLKDKKLNVMADLTQGDYTFTSEAGLFSDRFEIVYQPETVLATEGTTKVSLEVYRDAGDFVIRSSEKAIELMELYDASGRLVLSQKGNGKELRFAAATLAEGIYVVKTRLKDGQELTKKIRNK